MMRMRMTPMIIQEMGRYRDFIILNLRFLYIHSSMLGSR